jgi:microcystin-dependent protein
MTDPYLSEIRVVSFNFAPKGWALCNGQILSIPQNAPLFSLLGTFYGGDGIHNFALPNLQARVPLHVGSGFILGQAGGEATHTLTVNELPSHKHTPKAASVATSQTPIDAVWANNGANVYSTAVSDTALSNTAIKAQGASQPHENRPPFLTLNFIIALVGIFPARPD